ncbi:MAG: hypothetical protein M3Z07_00035 [Candidatus Eremiobacteraeota bacterium]|nr:hypothetical protein [Candidatus Eremiobacteraeota bacterium]
MFKLLVLVLLMAAGVLLLAQGMPPGGVTTDFALSRTQTVATALRWTGAGIGHTMVGLRRVLGARSGCSGGWSYRT